MNIFISYAREDANSANKLFHELETIPGVTPWLDTEKLLPGQRWKQRIMSALQTCDLFIILLSINSVSKTGYIQHEIIEALDKLSTFPPDQIFIIPARLDECYPKHKELNELQRVDMFPDWDAGFERIRKVIRSLNKDEFELPTFIDNSESEKYEIPEGSVVISNSRREMRGIDAMEQKFLGEQFINRDLTGANFVRCRFYDCDFLNTNLTGVNFEGASFANCLFAGANLWGVNFWGASVIGIQDLEKAIFKYTNCYWIKATGMQQHFLNENADKVVSLSDYGAFFMYFSNEAGLSQETIDQTFLWRKTNYFRRMFAILKKAKS
jgi:hypothetical protein